MKSLLIKSLMLISLLMPGILINQTVLAADCVSGTGTNAQQAIQQGANGASGINGCDVKKASQDSSSSLGTTITNVINVLSLLLGAVAVLMIIVGGFRYVTSGGKQEGVSAAKNTILYAVVGLIVAALAQTIVHFVLHQVQ